MSRETQETRSKLLGELAQELRQFNGLSASFFRAAAARMGVTVTDMQVIEILASTGPMTAGQLADLTGLTTGAITGMLNRLEEAGLILRERDPEDGRRVIVRLSPDKDQMRGIGPISISSGRPGRNWPRTTTMSSSPSCWTFSNAAMRWRERRLPCYKQRHRTRRASSPSRCGRRRAVG